MSILFNIVLRCVPCLYTKFTHNHNNQFQSTLIRQNGLIEFLNQKKEGSIILWLFRNGWWKNEYKKVSHTWEEDNGNIVFVMALIVVLSGKGTFQSHLHIRFYVYRQKVSSCGFFYVRFFCHPFKIPKWKWHRDYNGQRFLFFHGWPYTRFYEQLAAVTAAIQFDSTICHTFLMMIEGISAIFNIIFCLCHFIHRNVCAGNKLIKKVFFCGREFLL